MRVCSLTSFSAGTSLVHRLCGRRQSSLAVLAHACGAWAAEVECRSEGAATGKYTLIQSHHWSQEYTQQARFACSTATKIKSRHRGSSFVWAKCRFRFGRWRSPQLSLLLKQVFLCVQHCILPSSRWWQWRRRWGRGRRRRNLPCSTRDPSVRPAGRFSTERRRKIGREFSRSGSRRSPFYLCWDTKVLSITRCHD